MKSDLPTCSPMCTVDGSLTKHELETNVAMLKALAHPVRLRMVDLIHQHGGELCVCEFERHFALTQPTISHHLKILRDAAVIRSRRDGLWVRHAIEVNTLSHLQHLLEAFAHPQGVVESFPHTKQTPP